MLSWDALTWLSNLVWDVAATAKYELCLMNWLIGGNFLKSYLQIRFFVCGTVSFGGWLLSFSEESVLRLVNWSAFKNVQRDFYLKESSRKPLLMWTIIAHKFLFLISWFFMYLFLAKSKLINTLLLKISDLENCFHLFISLLR